MIQTVILDLNKEEYSKYLNAINMSIRITPLPDSSDPLYYENIKTRLMNILPPDYIILVSDSLEYNIQTSKNTAWIFRLNSTHVIVYRPKSIAFPQLVKCPPLTEEDTRKYLTENQSPFLTSSKLIKNTLFNEKQQTDLINLVRTVLNKNAEDKNPISQMMVYVKQFSLFAHENLFIHSVVVNSNSHAISYENILDELEEKTEDQTKVFQFEFKINSCKEKKRLIIFEKKAKLDTFSERFTNKWKEVLLVLFFILGLLVFNRCNNGEEHILGMGLERVCRNRNVFIYAAAFFFVGYMFTRHLKKSKERIEELKKKKKN